MSEGLNSVHLLGNLGADPELRYTPGGAPVLNLRLATTERVPPRDGVGDWTERTEWHRIVIWGKRAEALAKILGKGSTIFVEGAIRTTKYQGKDGTDRYSTDIVARNVLLTGSRGAGRPVDDSHRASAPRRAPEPSNGHGDGFGGDGGDFGADDDIPF